MKALNQWKGFKKKKRMKKKKKKKKIKKIPCLVKRKKKEINFGDFKIIGWLDPFD